MPFCTSCGASVGDDKFCAKCGAPVGQQSTMPPVPPLAPGPVRQPPGFGAPVPPAGYPAAPTKKKFPVWAIILIAVGSLVVIAGVIVAIAVPVFLSANTAAQRRTCQANLRTIDSAVQAYDAFYEAWPAEGPVRDALGTNWIERNPTCPTSSRTYTLDPPTEPDGPPTVHCPTNEPGHVI